MKRLVLFGFAGVLGMAGTALAGARANDTIMMDPVQRWAHGALSAVRNSPDIVQRIGCSTYTDPSGSSTTCYATDAAGKNWVSCYTFNPKFREAVRSIKGDSTLQFQWDTSGQCILIMVEDTSMNGPKQ